MQEFNIKYIIIISLLWVGVCCDPERAGVTCPPEITPVSPLKRVNDAKCQDRNEENLWTCESLKKNLGRLAAIRTEPCLVLKTYTRCAPVPEPRVYSHFRVNVETLWGHGASMSTQHSAGKEKGISNSLKRHDLYPQKIYVVVSEIR